MPDDISVSELDQRLQTERANQAAVAAKLNAIDQKLASEATRPAAARQKLNAASQLVESLSADLKAPAPADESALSTEARRWLLKTQLSSVNSEIRMLDQELLSQSARIELDRAQRSKSARSQRRIEGRIQALEELLTARRRSENQQSKITRPNLIRTSRN